MTSLKAHSLQLIIQRRGPLSVYYNGRLFHDFIPLDNQLVPALQD